MASAASIASLSSAVETAIVRRESVGARRGLEEVLRVNKPALIALLKNPARSPADADLVRKAQTDGIRLPHRGNPDAGDTGSVLQRLPSQVVEESLILSDMFLLNEISALQLLLRGEEQLSEYPGMTRGLVAVLMYYDGRKSLVQSLRTLVQGRTGVSWTLELDPEVEDLVDTFTGQLLEEGIVEKILALLAELDWTRESASLQRNMAFGDAKHRRQVRDLFHDVRSGLADVVFGYAAQGGLSANDVLRLLDFLAKVKPAENATNSALEPTTVTLLLALFYALDVAPLQKCEDRESAPVTRLPIVRDPQFIPRIHRELGPGSARRWEHPGLQSAAQFAWAMTVAAARANGNGGTAGGGTALPAEAVAAVIDDDEAAVDAALDNRVFHHLRDFLASNGESVIFKEEFYVKRLHRLLTDFIVLMPLKVKEIRNRADDAARNILMHEQEGIAYASPLAGQHFEHLLGAIAALYSNDELGLGLAADFWCPTDGGMTGASNSMVERFPQRQVALFKFVRMAGDLLMPSLYTPYVDMLVGLAGHPHTALHCFNLLKLNNGMNSVAFVSNGGQHQSSQPQQQSSTVSWDHFFHSMQQYFANLRQECAPHGADPAAMAAAANVYRLSRPMTRGISPAEINGLISVLRLVAAVASNCEAARVAIAENTAWQPLLLLIGLVGCAVPTHLKAELLRTLTALARSPEVAHVVWQSVEAAQLVSTVPSPPTGIQKQGLNTELDDVETRLEEYPMTLAFLHLLDVLIDSPSAASAVTSLGAGSRSPAGIEPYVAFVRDAVFLKFNTRTYRNPAEKWEVAAGCLGIVRKLLEGYEPVASDFGYPPAPTTSPAAPAAMRGRHPGFGLMASLLQSSELLRMVLFVLDEGVAHLETYVEFPGKQALQRSCLFALQILETALMTQSGFLDASRAAAASSLVLTGLDKLLLGVNPRSGCADHALNIAKFVGYAWWLPAHALSAVRVLCAVSESPSAHASLLSALGGPSSASVLKGFTDVLDDEQGDECIEQARLSIIDLLLIGLDKPAPSLSHFLLGFDLKKQPSSVSGHGVARSTLHAPGGVLGAVRTPLHAVLGMLRPEAGGGNPAASLTSRPKLCEAAYRLLYVLAANPQTSEPTLRYLRSTEDFLGTQLSLLPLPADHPAAQTSAKSVSWLLKTLAIELRVVSAARMRSQVSLLTSLLLDGGEYAAGAAAEGNDELTMLGAENTLSQLSRTMGATMSASVHMGSAGHGRQHRLLAILDAIAFDEETADPMPNPTWEVFDASQISELLKSCEMKAGNYSERSINVQMLHRILNEELAALQGSSALGQRQMIQQEIKNILVYAVRWNKLQEDVSARKSLLDAWRQVAEVLLCSSVPTDDVLTPNSKQQLLLDLLQTLLNKVLAEGTMPELANQVSGVVLLLVAALRQTYPVGEGDGGNKDSGEASSSADTFVSILDATTRQSGGGSAAVYSSALHVVLKGLVMWINNTSSAAQRVRANLYGGLLNYLRIGSSGGNGPGDHYKPGTSLEPTERAKFKRANLETIVSFGGDNFLDVVCRDTVSGHDIRRMLALSVIDELVRLDARGTWTHYMSNQGYLRHIVESLASEDEALCGLLVGRDDDGMGGNGPNMKSLYTYESKMAMLTRLAATVAGAELLLESGLMLRLAEMSVFSARPDLTPTASVALMEADSAVPSPLQRYHQILFPALRLCQALLSSLGGRSNLSASAQILHFVTRNEDLVRTVLRSRPEAPAWPMMMARLQETALLTGILARSMSAETFDSSGATSASDLELSSHATRIQRLMLALIPHFDPTDDLIRILRDNSGGDERAFRSAIAAALEINANVLTFARNISGIAGTADGLAASSAKYARILFTPSLAEAEERSAYDDYHTRGSSATATGSTSASAPLPNRPPSLGHVMLALNHLSSRLLSARAAHAETQQRLQFLDQMSTQEMAEYLVTGESGVGGGGGRRLAQLQSARQAVDKMSSADKKKLVAARMRAEMSFLEREASLCAAGVEAASLLVWRHLEHFLLFAASSSSADSTFQLAYRKKASAEDSSSADLSGIVSGSSFSSTNPETIERVKREAAAVLNDSFFARLDDVKQVFENKSQRGASANGDQFVFLEVVIRHLKRLAHLHTAS